MNPGCSQIHGDLLTSQLASVNSPANSVASFYDLDVEKVASAFVQHLSRTEAGDTSTDDDNLLFVSELVAE